MYKFKLKDCKENKDIPSRSIHGLVFHANKWEYSDAMDERIRKNFGNLIEVQIIDRFQYVAEVKGIKHKRLLQQQAFKENQKNLRKEEPKVEVKPEPVVVKSPIKKKKEVAKPEEDIVDVSGIAKKKADSGVSEIADIDSIKGED